MVRQEVSSQGNKEIGKDPWAASLTGLLVGMDYDWAGKGWKLGKIILSAKTQTQKNKHGMYSIISNIR